MTEYGIGDIVEQTNLGDMPCVVVGIIRHPTEADPVGRYDLESITGVVYENIPSYLMRSARPAAESVHGNHAEGVVGVD